MLFDFGLTEVEASFLFSLTDRVPKGRFRSCSATIAFLTEKRRQIQVNSTAAFYVAAVVSEGGFCRLSGLSFCCAPLSVR